MATTIGTENPQLARAVRELRQGRKLTMEQLAAASGLTTNTVWRIENGLARKPTAATLEKLAGALDVHAANLKGLVERDA